MNSLSISFDELHLSTEKSILKYLENDGQFMIKLHKYNFQFFRENCHYMYDTQI